eukprot:4803671-Amphidinium_carterae.1
MGSHRGSTSEAQLGACLAPLCAATQVRPGSYSETAAYTAAHHPFFLQGRPEETLAEHCVSHFTSFQGRPETFAQSYLFQVRPEQIWRGPIPRSSTKSASCTTSELVQCNSVTPLNGGFMSGHRWIS